MMNIISLLIVNDMLYVSLETNYFKTVYVYTIISYTSLKTHSRWAYVKINCQMQHQKLETLHVKQLLKLPK